MMAPFVSTATVSQLVIENWNYAFNDQGQPVIELIVKNSGTDMVQSDIAVKVMKASQSAQNEFVYKKVSNVNWPRQVNVLPGKVQRFSLDKAPVLKPGTYEAEVNLRHRDESVSRSYDFQVTSDAFEKAKTSRDEEMKASMNDSSISDKVSIASLMLLAVLIIIMGTRKWRRQ